MTLDDNLLQKSVDWNYIKLDFDKDLIDKYISTDNNNIKRELTLKFFEHIHKNYFNKFNNSYQFFFGLKQFEEEYLYRYLNYRDHFIHVFQVFLLGCYLVERANTESMPVEFLSQVDQKRFIRTWFLIAFYHDIGYIVEKLIEVGKKIQETYFGKISGLGLSEFELKFSDKLIFIFKDYLKFLSKGLSCGEEEFFISKNEKYDNLKIEIILNELEEGFKKRDHGIISSLFLYYTVYLDIDFITENTLIEQYKDDLNIACCAIALHSIEKKGAIHLDFIKNPFACLLIFCDNIQEWNRPTVKELQYIEFNIWEDLAIEIDSKNEIFKLKFTLNDNLTDNEMRKFFKFYFSEIERIFTLTFIKGHNYYIEFKNSTAKYLLKINYTDNSYKIDHNLV